MITKNMIKIGLVGLLALLLVLVPLMGACAPEELEEFTLKITAIGEGTTSPAPGTYTKTEGESVTVTATPNPDYEFSYWEGDVSGSTSPTTFKMTSDKSVVAVFVEVGRPEAIKVAYLADLTGPYAAVGAPLLDGFADYMEMINERGGIDGVPIDVLWADTRADAALTVSAYKRFKAQGILCLSCMVTPVALAIYDLVNEDKIPAINQSATLSLYIPPTDYMWCHQGVATNYNLVALYWFDTELWDREAWGAWTLGIIAHDNPFTLGGVAAMYKYADTHGLGLLKPEVVPIGTTDFSTNIMRLVDAGADVIYMETVAAGAGTCLKQMGDLGVIAETVEEAATVEGKAVPMMGYTSYLPVELTAAHDECEFTYGALPFGLPSEEELAGVKECNDFMISKYGRLKTPAEGGTAYRDGWNNGIVMVAAIERALAAVGWEDLNGETLMEYGLTELEFDPEGFSCEISYADYEGDRMAIEAFRPAAWDMAIWDRIAIGPCLKPLEIETVSECIVSIYWPAAADATWPMVEE